MALQKRKVEKEAYGYLSQIPKIPELDFVNTGKFNIVGEKEVLYPIVESSDVIIVGGAYFGDEGKGKTTDAAAHHPDVEIIMRANSGENAGHTVMKNGVKYVFHLAPSGILVPGKKNVIGSECVMDPVSFMENELAQLKRNNVEYPDLYVGNVHIVTPYHKLIDLIGNPKNSSTLKGMSPIHSTKAMKRGLRMNHLFNEEEVQAKRLKKDLHAYFGLLQTMNITEAQLLHLCEEINKGHGQKIPEHLMSFIKAVDKVSFLIELFKKYVVNNPDFPKRADTIKMINDALQRGKKVLIEGPQSFFLSNSVETHWGSATSACTSAAGIMAAAGYNFSKYRTKVINVHKSPGSSRVGIGANPSAFVPQDFFSGQDVDSLHYLQNSCEDFDNIQKQYFQSIGENGIFQPTTYVDSDGVEYDVNVALAISASKKHGEKGATTGKPRVLGLFDCVAHSKVNQAQGPYLTISAVDRGDDYDKIALAIAYVVHLPEGKEVHSNGRSYKRGDIIRPGEDLPCEQVLHYCYPIIKVMDGWKGNPIAAGKRAEGSDLPKQVQDFIEAIEHYTGAEVISIGNGPNKEDLLYVRKSISESSY